MNETTKLVNIRCATFTSNFLQVDSLPHDLRLVFNNGIQDPNIFWWQQYNAFFGGFPMPKIYSAFSKDIHRIPYYIPHSTNGRPLLAYKAQPYSDCPMLANFEQFLRTMGYDNFNFVTIVLYIGKGSKIKMHTDRQQIQGFKNDTDLIATFVFGSSRYRLLST